MPKKRPEANFSGVSALAEIFILWHIPNVSESIKLH
jgi:hypothetical protein